MVRLENTFKAKCLESTVNLANPEADTAEKASPALANAFAEIVAEPTSQKLAAEYREEFTEAFLVDKSILARKKKLNPVTELVLGTTYARQLAKEAHSKRLREVSPAPTASSSSQSNGAKPPPKSKGKYPRTLRCKYCKGKVTA